MHCAGEGQRNRYFLRKDYTKEANAVEAPVLAAKGLTKAYGGTTLFTGADIALLPGKCVAVTGHNGTGKTTLLKLLMGLIRPDGGTIARSKDISMAYIPERFPSTGLGALEFVLSMARIEGASTAEARERAEALFHDFFMTEMRKTPMKHLSKGSLQKVGVIQALVGNHDVLFLDEPLSGQDRDSQRVFIQKVQARKAQGTAVMLSCHEESLVSAIADEVLEIRKGKICLCDETSGTREAQARLRFSFTEAAGNLPGGKAWAVEPIEGGFLLRVGHSESNKAAATLMEMGYWLEAMNNEETL